MPRHIQPRHIQVKRTGKTPGHIMERSMVHDEKDILAGSFRSLMDPRSGEMDKRFRKQYEELIEFFESKGYTVHNAHKREKWGKAFMTPEECTKIDFEEIRSCDYFVAFPGSPPSPGTHIEIGWASAFGKHILLLLEHGQDYAFL